MEVQKTIPVKTVLGHGDLELYPSGRKPRLFKLPVSNDIFDLPQAPHLRGRGAVNEGLALLREIHTALDKFNEESRYNQFDLSALSPESLSLIDETFRKGEISATIEVNNGDINFIQIQQSVMAGVWRIKHINHFGKVGVDYIEVATFPTAILSKSHALNNATTSDLESKSDFDFDSSTLINELNTYGSAFKADDEPFVVNLSALAISDNEIEHLEERLGIGSVRIFSKVYGNCLVSATTCQNTWWIKYFDSNDNVILNTLEVIDIPTIARASNRDIIYSALRLNNIIVSYN